jgi:LEA14-like dessication related protein
MKNWVLPVVIVGIAAFYFLSKKKLADRLKVLFRGVKLSGSVLKPKFNLKFGVQNPTGASAKINSLVGQVEANGKIIADVSSFNTQVIAPKKESIYEITAEPYGAGIFKTIREFIKAGNKINFVFTGSINVDGIDYPVNTNIAL